MPGIVGIIRFGSLEENKRALDPMVKCMIHEKFYTTGVYINERFGIGAGWVCHPGSFSDCLPVWNETRDICLVFSGEHYADRAEVDRLRAAGHDCSGGNARYLVHLYEEHGMKFFELLNGSFSGLLIDLREDRIILFNDRYGLGRIYYHETADGFYFASEAKALLEILPQLRRLDMQSFGERSSCGCVLQNRTLFLGISLLPAGSAWTFKPQQKVRRESYFSAEAWQNQRPLPEDEYYEKLKETFARILPRYFSGQQKVAMSLTGGLFDPRWNLS